MEAFDELWDYDDPAASEERFRDLLPDLVAHGDESQRVQLLTQIARTLGLQRRFDDARAVLAEAGARLDGASDRARARWLLETGRCHNSSGSPERSLAFFLEAWELASECGEDFHAVDAAHMLAIVEPAPEERLAWTMRALELAESSDDGRVGKWPGSLHNNIGWTWHEHGDYERALEHFRKALAWRERQGDVGTIRIARWCIARCLRSLERVDEALAMQRALLEEKQAEDAPDGYVYEELGECLLLLGREGEARPWFARAYAELSADPWLQAEDADRLERLERLGQER
ncbi:MAG: tetratricopeptide repeat protein [Anaerolineaceae bacterium]|nr:tetratricopeptide repeat protein [Anaerolineaceae bacterium]MCY3905779.1 tetratricopeptide repeat protein [Anaerolineaceae bacterium]